MGGHGGFGTGMAREADGERHGVFVGLVAGDLASAGVVAGGFPVAECERAARKRGFGMGGGEDGEQ